MRAKQRQEIYKKQESVAADRLIPANADTLAVWRHGDIGDLEEQGSEGPFTGNALHLYAGRQAHGHHNT